MKKKIEYKIAKEINKHGGRVFYVGGYTRDKILNIKNNDVDIEVFNIDIKLLEKILRKYGTVLKFGKSFGIYNLKGQSLDIALPRKEKLIGKGHKDFEVVVDPFLDYKDAAKRRDFTINALYQDVLTSEIIDYFGGYRDLKNGLIKHIDDKTFVEDPLRVLRAAGFASRFNFKIDAKTIKLCQSIDIKTLSKERIEEEIKKIFIKNSMPSIFFKYIKKMNQLDYWFYELKKDLNKIIKFIDKTNQIKHLFNDKYSFMMAALCIYLNKDDQKQFIKRITNNKTLNNYIEDILKGVKELEKINNPSIYQTNVIFDNINNHKEAINLYLLKKYDINNLEYKKERRFLYYRLSIYKKYINRAIITGNDLINIGFKPDKSFKYILGKCHDYALKGLSKVEIINKIKK